MEHTERAGSGELPDVRDGAGVRDGARVPDAGGVPDGADGRDGAGVPDGAGRRDGVDGGHVAGGGHAVGPAAEDAPLAGGREAEPWSASTAGGMSPSHPGGRLQATGEPRVDAALARLDELAGQPVSEHRAIFDDVHRRLREVLGELDTHEQRSGDAAGAERRAGR